MNLDDLKAKDKNGSLNRMIETMKKTSGFKPKQKWDSDENEWAITRGKDGNGRAVIRFLPGIESEGLVFVEQFSHGFKYKGRWFIEKCPRTIDKPCPVCDDRFNIINKYGKWEAVPEQVKKDILSPRNNRKSFYANILVIKDPENPENEGKVFRFRFGQKIFDKIVAKLAPEFDDIDPIDVSDPDAGCNFRMKVKTVGEGNRTFPNYDDSEFDAPSKLPNAKKVLAMQHSLLDLIAEENFKTYEALEKKYFSIVGGGPIASNAEEADGYDTDEYGSENLDEPTSSASEVTQNSSPADDEDDDDYFARLAEDLV